MKNITRSWSNPSRIPPGTSCCSEGLQRGSPRRRRSSRGPSPCVLSRLTLREPLGGPGVLTEGASVNRHRSGSWVDAFRFSTVTVSALGCSVSPMAPFHAVCLTPFSR